MNLADQGRLLFLITHYTDKVKIIDKYPELLEFYNNLYEANNIMMPLTFYVSIIEQLIIIPLFFASFIKLGYSCANKHFIENRNIKINSLYIFYI
jgi:hypothetical protein